MKNIIRTDEYSIENLNETIGILYENPNDNKKLILDFGKKNKGDLATCNFIFKSEKLKIVTTSSSCGCTNPTFRKTENEGEQHLTIEFNPSQITNNVSKVATLYLSNSKSISINIIINKL